MSDSSHPAYPSALDIDAIITRLADQQADLSHYIDRRWSEPESQDDDDERPGLDAVHLARLLSIHSQNAAYLGRLLRDRQAIHGEPPDILEQATNEALHIVGTQWGIELIDPALLLHDGPGQPPIELDDVIADLYRKQVRLARPLAHYVQEDDDARFSRLTAAYSRGAARLGRLVRTRHALSRKTPEEIEDLCNQALTFSEQDLEDYDAPQP